VLSEDNQPCRLLGHSLSHEARIVIEVSDISLISSVEEDRRRGVLSSVPVGLINEVSLLESRGLRSVVGEVVDDLVKLLGRVLGVSSGLELVFIVDQRNRVSVEAMGEGGTAEGEAEKSVHYI
jgi:hypothetical protein